MAGTFDDRELSRFYERYIVKDSCWRIDIINPLITKHQAFAEVAR